MSDKQYENKVLPHRSAHEKWYIPFYINLCNDNYVTYYMYVGYQDQSCNGCFKIR